jgi:hypothetical protein
MASSVRGLLGVIDAAFSAALGRREWSWGKRNSHIDVALNDGQLRAGHGTHITDMLADYALEDAGSSRPPPAQDELRDTTLSALISRAERGDADAANEAGVRT